MHEPLQWIIPIKYCLHKITDTNNLIRTRRLDTSEEFLNDVPNSEFFLCYV